MFNIIYHSSIFYIVFFSLLLIISLLIVSLNKKFNIVHHDKYTKLIKILTLIYIGLVLFNLLLPDGITFRGGEEFESYYHSGEHIWYVLLRWLNDSAFIILPIAVFYKKKPFIQIACFILSISCIINAACFYKFAQLVLNGHGEGIASLRYFSTSVKNFFYNLTFRGIYLGLMLMIEWIIIFSLFVKNKENIKFNNVKEVKNFIVIFILIFISSMPIYAPQYLMRGYPLETNFTYFTIFKPMHFVWIIWMAVKGVLLYLYFRKKDYETKYIAMLVLTLALLIQFNGIFTCFGEIYTQRLPFQLCNFAGIIIALALITKKKIFYIFTLTVNAVGAIFAIVMCDSSNNSIWYIMNVHYIVEHTQVFLIPILCFVLHIFEPITKKDVWVSIKGYTFYYLLVFLIGGIFWGIRDVCDPANRDFWECNYLFMFNAESTISIASFTKPFFECNFKLFNFFPINLFQLVVYIVFLGLSTGAFYILYNIDKKRSLNENKLSS